MSVVDAHFAVTSPVGSYDFVVKAQGEIDMASGPQLRQVLQNALLGQPRTLTVDMAGVSFMDSTGLNLLVGTLKQCQMAAIDLIIRAPSAGIVRVFEVCGLDKVMHIVLDPDGTPPSRPRGAVTRPPRR